MPKFIAHVFTSRFLMHQHIENERQSDQSVTVDIRRPSYTKPDGTTHCCYAIRTRDDISDFIGTTFQEHHIHGDFHHLKPDDLDYMKWNLIARTRPEAA
jgi:hypothetical protein